MSTVVAPVPAATLPAAAPSPRSCSPRSAWRSCSACPASAAAIASARSTGRARPRCSRIRRCPEIACSPPRCATTACARCASTSATCVCSPPTGRVVASTPVFLQTFGKSLWAAGRGPQQVPDTELLRTGRIALLKPGQEVPLTVAWHAADGDPVRVAYGGGSLALE